MTTGFANAPGPLGFIVPSQRTQEQNDAHDAAMARMGKFAMPDYADPPVGTKVMLPDFFKTPEVTADIGFQFNGFRQLTGACVGASAGNAKTCLSAVQRMIADSPTKAILDWWPFAYGTTRYAEGDRGQGEGAVDSVMGETMHGSGTFDARQPGLPSFDTSDGLALTSKLELQWSDGGKIDPKWKTLAAPNVVGTVASLNSVQDIRAAIVNGYPVLDGCDNYIGHGTIKGSGDNAYVTGHYDGRGRSTFDFATLLWSLESPDGWVAVPLLESMGGLDLSDRPGRRRSLLYVGAGKRSGEAVPHGR